MYQVNPNAVRPGQTVQFVYSGGTIPNVHRLIAVESVDADHINGRDLEANDFRSFLKSKVGDNKVQIIAQENEELIQPSRFLSVDPSSVKDTALVSIFSMIFPKRKGVRYDPRVKAIVALRDDLPRVEILVGEKQTVVDFIGSDGKPLGLSFDYNSHGPSFDVPHKMVCPMDESVLAKFAEQLYAATRLQKFAVSTTVPGWQEHCDKMVAAGNPLYTATGT